MSLFLRILYEFFDTRDLYEVLCVDKNEADVTEAIKKAYKKMALKFHPDKNKSYSAEEKFKVRYRSIWVSVSGLNQNSGFGRTLTKIKYYKSFGNEN